MSKIRIFSLTLLSLVAIYIALSFLILPGIAHTRIENALAAAGFNTSYMPGPRAAIGAIYYGRFQLDEDNFSSIGSIRAVYDPISLLLLGKFYSIEISGLTLTGDIAGNDLKTISFAGWRSPATTASLPLKSFSHLAVKGSNVALLTSFAGGMSFSFNLVAGRQNGQTEFQANIKSAQKSLSLLAMANGFIKRSQWAADIDIENGKFESPGGEIKASRLSGAVKLSSFLSEGFRVTGDMRAGAAWIYGLPWNNVSTSFTLSGDNVDIFSEGKSVGLEGMELEMNMNRKDGGEFYAEGSIHADQTETLLKYLENKPAFANLRAHAQASGIASDITIKFLSIPDLGVKDGIKYKILAGGEENPDGQ